jgi:hypothetical protein
MAAPIVPPTMAEGFNLCVDGREDDAKEVDVALMATSGLLRAK